MINESGLMSMLLLLIIMVVLHFERELGETIWSWLSRLLEVRADDNAPEGGTHGRIVLRVADLPIQARSAAFICRQVPGLEGIEIGFNSSLSGMIVTWHLESARRGKSYLRI